QGADAVLQDRRRVPRMAQRAAGSFRHGRRAGKRPLADPPRRAVPPRRQGARAARPGACGIAHAQAARRAWARVTAATRTEGLSINLATVREQWNLAQAVDACVRHGITAIDPWRDQVAATGLAEAARIIKANGLRVTGYCRGGMFPAADAAG